jgi:hypothetical protein
VSSGQKKSMFWEPSPSSSPPDMANGPRGFYWLFN